MHLIVPMSGQGTRFRAAGYSMPKPLVPLDGELMIARVLDQYPMQWPVIAVTADNHRGSGLIEAVQAKRPHARMVEVPQHKEGPAIAIEAALAHVPHDEPILVSYCDFGLVWDAHAFERMVLTSGCDAALVTYRGFQPHYASQTPYAYARVEGDCVREVREKGSFTAAREYEHASAGAYYFRSRQVLEDALRTQRARNMRVNNELYTSLTVQAVLAQDPHAYVRVFEAASFFQWGTPEDVCEYLYWLQTFSTELREQRARLSDPSPYTVEQLVRPMAGGGTRFRSRSRLAKPLLPVDQEPMFVAATRSLPKATARRVYVARASDAPDIERLAPLAPGTQAKVVPLPSTPPGQALSTQAALDALDLSAPVLVSACDHAIALHATDWQAFQAAPGCDAAIFTVTGYPGAARRPHSFAYVEAAPEPAPASFPAISRISVKVPLSATPARDAVLVGTFWFRTAAILREAIDAVVAADRRVNGELYLDTALSLLLEQGRCLRMIPLSGYINWGAPDAYDEALYWRQALVGQSPSPPFGALPAPPQDTAAGAST